jgi:hypothetical protein
MAEKPQKKKKARLHCETVTEAKVGGLVVANMYCLNNKITVAPDVWAYIDY